MGKPKRLNKFQIALVGAGIFVFLNIFIIPVHVVLWVFAVYFGVKPIAALIVVFGGYILLWLQLLRAMK